MARFRNFLRNKNFSFLWIAQIISQFGDRLDQMALVALVFKMTPGSTLGLAKLISITILPVFLIGPIAGIYVDRWDRRRTMYISDFARAILIFLIPTCFMQGKNLVPVYIIVFLAFCLSRFFIPAKMSIIPDLVNKDDLLMANSLVNITGMVAAAVGLGIGGVVVEIIGVKGGFYVDALTFLISGALILFVSTKTITKVKPREVIQVGREIAEVIRKSVSDEIKEVLRFLRKEQSLGYILHLLFFLWALLGSAYVVIIVFIQNVFSSAVKDLGLLAICLGMGLFSGSLMYGKFGKIISYLKAIYISLILSGIILITFCVMTRNYADFLLSAVLSFILGLVISPIMIASNTIIHELTQSHMRGKIFSGIEIIMHLAFLIFMFFTSFLAEKIGPYPILLSIGIILIGSGIFEFIRNRHVKVG